MRINQKKQLALILNKNKDFLLFSASRKYIKENGLQSFKIWIGEVAERKSTCGFDAQARQIVKIFN